MYKDAKAKELYHDFIFNSGKSNHIIVNNKVYTFKINSLTIGGLNTTYCDFKNNMSVNSLRTSLLKAKSGNKITEKHGISV